MDIKCLTIALLFGLNLTVWAEERRFQNADETKSFYAELVGFDEPNNRVTVKLKTGRKKTFLLELLSKDDQDYVKENGKRLAVGNDLRVSLKRFQGKSEKRLAPRIVDRVAPCGYTISLNNRANNEFSDITINYTLYYAVQDYLKPERTLQEKSGTLECKKILSRATHALLTETVEIVSGKLEPVITYKTKKDSNGNNYQEAHVDKPGGRRKDQLIGCKVEIVIDGEVVKTETDGTLSLEKATRGK